MTAAIITAFAVAAAVTVPVLLHVWATGRPRFALTDAGERAAAQAVEGQTSVIVWDRREEKYVRATRHPSGVIHIEVLSDDAIADMLAREVGAA